jgi:hypothetical protein
VAKPKLRTLTIERLRELLTYDPETGVFHRPKGHRFPIAGWVNSVNGYRYIDIDGERYLAQRLAWFYMTGTWPDGEVDHRNLRRDDNWWENLRAATKAQNMQNTALLPTNKSGHKGVSWCSQRTKWVAMINCAGRQKNLGRYDSIEEAVAAYRRAATAMHGEFARTEVGPLGSG